MVGCVLSIFVAFAQKLRKVGDIQRGSSNFRVLIINIYGRLKSWLGLTRLIFYYILLTCKVYRFWMGVSWHLIFHLVRKQTATVVLFTLTLAACCSDLGRSLESNANWLFSKCRECEWLYQMCEENGLIFCLVRMLRTERRMPKPESLQNTYTKLRSIINQKNFLQEADFNPEDFQCDFFLQQPFLFPDKAL